MLSSREIDHLGRWQYISICGMKHQITGGDGNWHLCNYDGNNGSVFELLGIMDKYKFCGTNKRGDFPCHKTIQDLKITIFKLLERERESSYRDMGDPLSYHDAYRDMKRRKDAERRELEELEELRRGPNKEKTKEDDGTKLSKKFFEVKKPKLVLQPY